MEAHLKYFRKISYFRFINVGFMFVIDVRRQKSYNLKAGFELTTSNIEGHVKILAKNVFLFVLLSSFLVAQWSDKIYRSCWIFQVGLNPIPPKYKPKWNIFDFIVSYSVSIAPYLKDLIPLKRRLHLVLW